MWSIFKKYMYTRFSWWTLSFTCISASNCSILSDMAWDRKLNSISYLANTLDEVQCNINMHDLLHHYLLICFFLQVTITWKIDPIFLTCSKYLFFIKPLYYSLFLIHHSVSQEVKFPRYLPVFSFSISIYKSLIRADFSTFWFICDKTDAEITSNFTIICRIFK